MSARSDRLLELDVLRGLAASAVLGFHYTTRYDELYAHADSLSFALPAGYLGVHLFFVISGFVIMMTLDRTRRSADFAISRFARLFPAYWAAVLFTASLVTIFGLPGREVTLAQTLVNLTMVQEYFGVEHVDGVYWTLTSELTFYTIMLGLHRLRLLSKVELVCVVWLFVVAIVAALRFVAGIRLPLVQELTVAPFAHLFIAGIAFFRGRQLGFTPLRIGLIAAAIAAQTVESIESAVVVAGIVLVFTALIHGRLRWLALRPLVWLGSLTYTLYLVHQNLGYVVIRWGYAQGFDPHLSIALAVLTTLSVATLISVTIERPMQQVFKKALRREPRTAPAAVLAPATALAERTHPGAAVERVADASERPRLASGT